MDDSSNPNTSNTNNAAKSIIPYHTIVFNASSVREDTDFFSQRSVTHVKNIEITVNNTAIFLLSNAGIIFIPI